MLFGGICGVNFIHQENNIIVNKIYGIKKDLLKLSRSFLLNNHFYFPGGLGAGGIKSDLFFIN